MPVVFLIRFRPPCCRCNGGTVPVLVCNATGKRNRFLFPLTNEIRIYVKITPPTTYQLSKKFIGYGHYELTISSSEGTKTIVTGNMDLIERLNSEIDKEKEEATAEAIALVLESSL